MYKTLTVLLLVLFAAGSAQAVISAQWALAPDPGSNTPAGYTAWDLMVTVSTDLAVQELILTGSNPNDIYQNLLAGDPRLPLQTHASYITVNPAGPDSVNTTLAGAAVDIQAVPARSMTFDDQLLDIAWGPVGTFDSGAGTFAVARAVIKDTAWVAWDYWGKEQGQVGATTASGFIPEPTTLLLLVGPALAGLLRRR